MCDVIYMGICLATGFFFGVFATVIGLVLIEDMHNKNNGGKKNG